MRCDLGHSGLLALCLAYAAHGEQVEVGATSGLFSRSAALNCSLWAWAAGESSGHVGCVAAEFSSAAPVTRAPAHRPRARMCCDASCKLVHGSVALVERGGCSFHQKAWMAQQAGAAAVVVVNTEEAGAAFPMGTDAVATAEQPIAVPVVMVSHHGAAALLRSHGVASSALPVLELLLAAEGTNGGSVGFLPHVVPDGSGSSGPVFVHNPRILVRTELLPASRTARDFRVFVHAPATCRFISKSIMETGIWEATITARVLERLGTVVEQQGSTQPRVFVDVGANLGWFSLLAAAQGHDVLAIEPMEFNAELLRASAELNRRLAAADGTGAFGSVRLFKVALAESERPPMCVLPAFDGDPVANAGNGQMHPLTQENAARCTDVVNVTTIDALLQREGVRSVFAIKLDIEGFETLALRGASGLLGAGEHRPCFVFAEFWAKYTVWSGVKKLELFERMLRYGYEVFTMDGHLQVTAALVATDDVEDGDYEFRLRAPHCPRD